MSRFTSSVSGNKIVDGRSGLRVSLIPKMGRRLKTTPIYYNPRVEYTGELECEICKVKYKAITESHLRYVHNTSMKEYRELFPSANLFDASTISKIKEIQSSRGFKYIKSICVNCGKEFLLPKQKGRSGVPAGNMRVKTCSPECLHERRKLEKEKSPCCRMGHKLDKENTIICKWIDGKTFRKCRICINKYKRSWRQLRKAAKTENPVAKGDVLESTADR